MLSTVAMAFAGGVAIIVGVLIGAIGIGGVLLVPMLTYALGFGIHVAIATAMFSYLFSGAVSCGLRMLQHQLTTMLLFINC